MNSVLCTICARGGSKGVKNKNIRDLNGKPLFAHTIIQAQESNLFRHIVLSTDSDEIAEIGLKFGAEVFFKRVSELSTDEAGKLDVIRDAFKKSEAYFGENFDYLVDLDATSPLRLPKDIINSFNIFIRKQYNNLITAAPARKSPYFNLVELDEEDRVILSKKLNKQILRRQDAPRCYDMNASIYIWTRQSILNDISIFNDNTGLFVMPEERSIDIDTELDFKFVEFLMKAVND